jgi:hypothetical protein
MLRSSYWASTRNSSEVLWRVECGRLLWDAKASDGPDAGLEYYTALLASRVHSSASLRETKRLGEEFRQHQ